MAQCESKVFFPDDPTQHPQFSECPRQAQTTRHTWRFGDRAMGGPPVVNSVVKLCCHCASIWDAVDIHANSTAGSASIPAGQHVYQAFEEDATALEAAPDCVSSLPEAK